MIAHATARGDRIRSEDSRAANHVVMVVLHQPHGGDKETVNLVSKVYVLISFNFACHDLFEPYQDIYFVKLLVG